MEILNRHLEDIFQVTLPGEPAGLAAALADPESMRRISRRMLWFDRQCAMQDCLVGLVTEVSRAVPAFVLSYLEEGCGLDDLLPVIMSHSDRYRHQVGRATCLNDLGAMESAVDETVMAHLGRLARRPVWRVLGFGGGDCSYEMRIGSRLAGDEADSTWRLFRYDPYWTDDDESVADLDLLSSLDGEDIGFDVIMCRWVLHHVPGDDRWSAISAAASRLDLNGALVIIEEGDFPRRDERSPLRAAFRLIVACQDVLVNGILRPQFVDVAAGAASHRQFTLSYLTEEDLDSIEDHLPPGMRRHVYLPGAPEKTGEIVFIYSHPGCLVN